MDGPLSFHFWALQLPRSGPNGQPPEISYLHDRVGETLHGRADGRRRMAGGNRYDFRDVTLGYRVHVNGKRVSFTENVFYEFRSEKIREVWSVIDKAAIEAQL